MKYFVNKIINGCGETNINCYKAELNYIVYQHYINKNMPTDIVLA